MIIVRFTSSHNPMIFTGSYVYSWLLYISQPVMFSCCKSNIHEKLYDFLWLLYIPLLVISSGRNYDDHLIEVHRNRLMPNNCSLLSCLNLQCFYEHDVILSFVISMFTLFSAYFLLSIVNTMASLIIRYINVHSIVVMRKFCQLCSRFAPIRKTIIGLDIHKKSAHFWLIFDRLREHSSHIHSYPISWYP